MKALRFYALVTVFLTATAMNVMAQNLVKGKVVDKNGEPVVGAAVYLVENPTKGAVTDLDGNWSLDVAPGSTLHFSSIGFLDKDVKPGNQSVIDVVMEEDVNLLDDVVVIGYGTARKRDMTGAVSNIKAEKIAERKCYIDSDSDELYSYKSEYVLNDMDKKTDMDFIIKKTPSQSYQLIPMQFTT